jgi:plasmid maintenance system antidote protein VapI
MSKPNSFIAHLTKLVDEGNNRKLVGQAIGVDALSAVINGERPLSADQAVKIAGILGTTAKKLLNKQTESQLQELEGMETKPDKRTVKVTTTGGEASKSPMGPRPVYSGRRLLGFSTPTRK